MYSLLEMEIFHCYVSLPEGSWKIHEPTQQIEAHETSQLHDRLVQTPKKNSELYLKPKREQFTNQKDEPLAPEILSSQKERIVLQTSFVRCLIHFWKGNIWSIRKVFCLISRPQRGLMNGQR